MLRSASRAGLGWRILVPLGIAVSAVLVACGGGGGGTASTSTSTPSTPETPSTPATASSVVTGTAASGAALANLVVTLKDSTNAAVTATTSVSGAFTLDSSKLAPPFLLQVTTPGGIKLLSVSTDANKTATINITPLTDVVVRSFYSLRGQSADTAFSNPGTLPPPTPAQVKALAQTLMNNLQLAVAANGAPVSDPMDLIARPFAADHTGMDKLLDNARVTMRSMGADLVLTAGSATQTTQLAFDTATLAITASNSTTSGTGTAAVSTTSTSTDVMPVQTAQATAMDQMKATLAAVANMAMGKGMMLVASDLEPYFAADLLEDGSGRTEVLQDIVRNMRQMQSVRLELVQVRSLDLTAGKALVQMRFTGMMNGVTDSDVNLVMFTRGSDGTWRYAGNGRMARIEIQAEGRSTQGLSGPGTGSAGTGTSQNGPAVNIDVRPPAASVSAVTATSSFSIPAFQRGAPEVRDSGQQLDVFISNTGPISGTLPAAGTPVNVTLTKSAGGTTAYAIPLNAFTTELIQITSPSPSTTSVRAGTLAVAWTLPRTYAVQVVKLNVQTFTADQSVPGSGYQCVQDTTKVAATATSATVTIPATCNNLPVKAVSVGVATEGMNGERSYVAQQMILAP